MAGDGDDNEVNSKKSPEDQGQAEKDGSENRSPEQDRAEEIASDQKRATGEFQTEALNEFKAESQRKTAENKKPDVPEAGQLDTMTGQVHEEKADAEKDSEKQNSNDGPNDSKDKDSKDKDSKSNDSKDDNSKEKNAKEHAEDSGESDGGEAPPEDEKQQKHRGLGGEAANEDRKQQHRGLGEERSQSRSLNGDQLDLSTGKVLNEASESRATEHGQNAGRPTDGSEPEAKQSRPGADLAGNNASAAPRDGSSNNVADLRPDKPVNSADNTVNHSAEAPTQVMNPGANAENAVIASRDSKPVSAGDNTVTASDNSAREAQVAPAADSTVNNNNNNNPASAKQDTEKPATATDANVTPNAVTQNPATNSLNSFSPPSKPLEGATTPQASSFRSFDTTRNLSTNAFQPGDPLPEVKTVAVRTVTNNGADRPATTAGDQQTSAPQENQTAPREQQTTPQGEQTTPQGDRPSVPQGEQKPAQTTQGLFSPESIASKPVPLETQPRANDTSSNATQSAPDANNNPLTPKVVKTERVTTQVQGDLPGSTPILQSNSFQPTPEAQRDVPITTVNTVNANDRLPQSTNTDSSTQHNSGDNTAAQPRQQAAPSSDIMFNPTPIAEQRVELQSGSAQTGSASDQNASKAPAGSSGVFFDSTPLANQRVEMSGGNTLSQAQEAYRQEPSSGSGSALNNMMFNPEPIAQQNPSNYEQPSAGSAGNSLDARPVTTQTVHEQVGGPSLGYESPSSGSFTPHNEPLSQNVTMAEVRPSSGAGDYGSSGSDLGGGANQLGGKNPGYDMLSPTPIAEQNGGLHGSGSGEHGLASTNSGIRPESATASATASHQPSGLDSGAHGSASSTANLDGSSQSLTRSANPAETASNHNSSSSHDSVPVTGNDKAQPQQLASTAPDTTRVDAKNPDVANKPADGSAEKPPSAMPTLERNVAERTAQPVADVNNRPNIMASAGKDTNEGSNTTQQERLQRIENLARMAQAFVSMDVPRLPGQVNVSDNQNGKSSFPQGSNIALSRNSTGSVVGTPGELARSTVDGARSMTANTDRFAGAVSLSTLTGKGTDGILGLNGQISRVGTDGRLVGNAGQFSALTSGRGLFGDNRVGLPGENRTFRGLGTDGFNNSQQNGGRVRFDGRTGNPTGRGTGVDGSRGIRGSAFDQQLISPIGVAGSKLNDSTLTFKNGRLDFSSGGKRYLTGVEIALAAALAAAAIAKKRPEDDLSDEDLAKGQLSELLEGSGDEQKDVKTAKDGMYFRQSVAAANLFQRPTHLVQPNESLISIAEDYFNDSDIAWLIADINAANIIQHFEDGKRIVELKSRQEIQLPLPSEITEFFATKSKEHKGELIVTIIVESQIDTELLNNFLGTIVGAAQTAQAPEPSTMIAAPAVLANKAEASFQDDTLAAIRSFGKNIMPTVHALLNSGKNLRTFISRVDEVPPTPTSPPSLKAVEKDKVTA